MNNDQKTIEIIIRGQQANATIREMQSATRVLNAEIRKMVPGTDEFIKKTKEFQDINKRLKSLTDEVKGVGGVFSKIGAEIKAFGVIAVSALGFQWLSSKIQDLIGQNAKLSDSFADIRKTTGMSEAEVTKLNKTFSQMNTRTATKDLRDIAVSAGQLGIAKKDILSFTASMDKLVVVLSSEFTGGAEEISNTMGKLRNVFADIKSDNISEDLLHIGNAVNALGASGMATGPVISDFANRIGGVGINLGLTSGQVLGLSATLQELNVSTERGGTAMSKLLLHMTQHTKDFAKVAGMDLQAFTNMVNNDLYGAFVKVAAGAAKGGSSATAFGNILDSLGADGAGVSEVLSKLGRNTGLLQEKVDLANKSLTNTDSIMNSFAIKNENFAADLDIIGKKLSNAFVNGAVMNGMKSMVGWIADLARNTNLASTAMQEEQVKVNALVIELQSANTTQARRVAIYNELEDINPKIVAGIDAENISMAALTANVKLYNQEQINRIVIQKLQEKVDAANKDAAEKAIAMAEQQALAYGQLTKVETLKGKVGIEARKIVADETLAISEKVKQLKTLAHDEEWYADKQGNIKRNGQAQLLKDIVGSGLLANSEKEYAKAVDLSAQMLEEKNKMMKQLGIDPGSNTTVTGKKEEATAIITIDDETAKKIKAAKEKLNEEIAKLNDEAYNRGLGKDAEELAKVDQKYAKLLVEARKFKGEEARVMDLYAKEYADLQQQQEEKSETKRRAAAAKLISDTDKLQNEIYLASLNEKDRAVVQVMQKYEELIRLAGDNKDAVVALKQQESDEINGIVKKQLSDEELALKKALAEKEKIKKGYEKRVETAARAVVSAYIEIKRNEITTELNENDEKLKKELAANDNALKRDLISKKVHDERELKINKKHDDAQRDIKMKAYDREQKIAISTAIINGVISISKTLAEYKYPINLAMAALDAIPVGAQIAAAKSAPKPYAKGGFNTSDNPQGFTNGPTHYTNSASGSDFIAGEDGKEYIIPNWMIEHPKVAPIVDHLETVRQNRGFASGGSNSTKTAEPVFSKLTATGNNDAVLVAATAAINRLNAHLDEGVEAYLSWDRYDRDLSKIDNAKSAARIG